MLLIFIEWIYSTEEVPVKELKKELYEDGIDVDCLIKKIRREINKAVKNPSS